MTVRLADTGLAAMGAVNAPVLYSHRGERIVRDRVSLDFAGYGGYRTASLIGDLSDRCANIQTILDAFSFVECDMGHVAILLS